MRTTAGVRLDGAVVPPRTRADAGLDLRVRVGELTLANPVMTASGTSGHGVELAPYVDLAALGAVVVKSLSVDPWPGNPAPRIVAAGTGMLNSVGLQNPGVDAWIDTDLPALARAGATVVASIWGRSAPDYRRAARAVAAGAAASPARVVALEANVSCPNVEDRGRIFAHDAAATAAVVAATAEGLEGSGLALWVKLSPNVTDLVAIAGAALDAGAGALTLVNTLMGLALDPLTGRPRLGGGGGGLSGPPLHPVAVRAVFECRAAFPDAVLIGVGGVTSGADAAELLVAGADAVQVGSATFADPRAPARVLGGLARWCRHHGIERVADLRGRAHGQ